MTTPRVTVPVEPEFTRYRRSQIAHLRPYVAGEALSDRVSISAADLEAGSPKQGDMIARNPANHDDQWLVAADYFAANFEPVSAAPAPEGGAVGVASAGGVHFAVVDHRVVGEAHDTYAETESAALAASEEAPAEAEDTLHPDAQPFEQYPELALHIERMAMSGVVGSMISWDAFLRELNAALRAQPPARPTASDIAKFADANMTPEAKIKSDIGHPPAREDAQPVAEADRSKWISDARDFTERMTSQPMACEIIERLLDIITHPAPDALRVAVEAVTEIRDGMVAARQDISVDDWIEKADQALAALQAEQGAK